ncbi:MAG: hypothetical protein HGB26_07855, partial [Desulfobulbaceae bacterium]|nr:hypothetical protein [Desulfobulbaceae bacterium]
NWLFSQIAFLPRLTHKTPKNTFITNINYNDANINIAGDCIACSITNNWEQVRLFILETLQCKHCGERHIAPIPDDVVKRISSNINKLVAYFGKIALWGINSYIYSLAEKLDINNKERIYFVDKSTIRQGLNISGNIIQPTNIIDDNNLRCVVVVVVQYYAGLVKPIRDEYPQVEHVLSISQLLSDDIIIHIK